LRFIPIPSPPNLPPRWTTVSTRRIAGVKAKRLHASRSKYIKKYSSWGLLKKWLSQVSFNKCWYCEAKSARAPFDVDHFRPKLGVTIDGVLLAAHGGYYWLAYDWRNFRLSCQRCNRPEESDTEIVGGKANEFPIRDEAHRCALPATSLATEEPRFLDPCVQADCELLAHGLDGEVKPVAVTGTWDYQRARYTIERLGFNDWNTPEAKRACWRLLDDLIRLAGDQPAVITHLQEHLSAEHEYSSFFRSAIGTHRDKTWVETIL
jgi:hypothetical protein